MFHDPVGFADLWLDFPITLSKLTVGYGRIQTEQNSNGGTCMRTTKFAFLPDQEIYSDTTTDARAPLLYTDLDSRGVGQPSSA